MSSASSPLLRGPLPLPDEVEDRVRRWYPVAVLWRRTPPLRIPTSVGRRIRLEGLRGICRICRRVGRVRCA
jgi:hypothetical protein